MNISCINVIKCKPPPPKKQQPKSTFATLCVLNITIAFAHVLHYCMSKSKEDAHMMSVLLTTSFRGTYKVHAFHQTHFESSRQFSTLSFILKKMDVFHSLLLYLCNEKQEQCPALFNPFISCHLFPSLSFPPRFLSPAQTLFDLKLPLPDSLCVTLFGWNTNVL